MDLMAKRHINHFGYRVLKGSLLAGVVYLFGSHTSTFNSPESAQLCLLSGLMIQLLLLIRLPHNDIRPLRNGLIHIRSYFIDEARFGGLMIGAAFFLNLQTDPLLFGLMILSNFMVQTSFFFLWRLYYLSLRKPQHLRRPSSQERNILIVGAGKRGMRAADLLLKHTELDIRIIGFIDFHRGNLWSYREIPLLGHPSRINSIISRNQVDFVVMAIEAEDFMASQEIFDTVQKMGIKLCLMPDIYDRTISRCCASSLNGQPVLLYHSVPENRPALFAKNIIDRVGALAGVIMTLPILITAAIAIKIDSRGPIFYNQRRVGRNGRIFKMIKLRTMRTDAEKLKNELKHLNEMSGPVFKIKRDPRITRVGRILRKYSIDEMPQFYNVLKGDMSLVGPRPPLPDEVKEYTPWHHRRLSVKPGVTCLWQVNGRNDIDFEEWMRLDLKYIDNWSLKEDARILAKTFSTVVRGSGH
jgi:exopolysaccharide biosynthesis polyprenyl glycosylphosphotransferase